MDKKDTKNLTKEKEEVFPISPELDQAIYEAFQKEHNETHDEAVDFISI